MYYNSIESLRDQLERRENFPDQQTFDLSKAFNDSFILFVKQKLYKSSLYGVSNEEQMKIQQKITVDIESTDLAKSFDQMNLPIISNFVEKSASVNNTIENKSQIAINLASQLLDNSEGITKHHIFDLFFMRLFPNSIRRLIWKAELKNLQKEEEYKAQETTLLDNYSKRMLEFMGAIPSFIQSKFPQLIISEETIKMLSNVLFFIEFNFKLIISNENIYMLLQHVFNSKNIFSDGNFIAGMMCSLLKIHSVYNGAHVSQAQPFLYESQLEEHIVLLLEALGIISINSQKLFQDMLIRSEDYYSNNEFHKDIGRITFTRLHLGGFIRRFLESMGAGFLDVETTSFIWDIIFLKRLGAIETWKIELFIGLAACISCLQHYIVLAKNVEDFVLLFNSKSFEVQPYDIYLIYLDIYRDTNALKRNLPQEELPSTSKYTPITQNFELKLPPLPYVSREELLNNVANLPDNIFLRRTLPIATSPENKKLIIPERFTNSDSKPDLIPKNEEQKKDNQNNLYIPEDLYSLLNIEQLPEENYRQEKNEN